MSGNETQQEKRTAMEEWDKNRRVDTESLMDNFYLISKGQKPVYKNAGGANPTGLIDTSADRPDVGVEAPHIDFDSVMEGMGMSVPNAQADQPAMNSDLGDLSPLINKLAMFEFSVDRQSEIEILRESLQEGIRRIKQSRCKRAAINVVENTKKISTGISKFYNIKTGGLRCEFSILGQKYSMLAIGQFQGNEVLCWSADGNDVIGRVMKYDHNTGKYAVTNNEFDIKITKGWK